MLRIRGHLILLCIPQQNSYFGKMPVNFRDGAAILTFIFKQLQSPMAKTLIKQKQ